VSSGGSEQLYPPNHLFSPLAALIIAEKWDQVVPFLI
jgi:hypothetical protein